MSGPLENDRHERFAQAIFQGKTATEAYVIAGYKANAGNCIRLKGNERIQARLRELQGLATAAVVAEVALSRITVLKELAKLALAPLDDANVRPADKRAALVDVARIEGWLIEKKEVGKPGEFESLNADDLRAFVTREIETLGLGHAPPPATNGSGKPH